LFLVYFYPFLYKIILVVWKTFFLGYQYKRTCSLIFALQFMPFYFNHFIFFVMKLKNTFKIPLNKTLTLIFALCTTTGQAVQNTPFVTTENGPGHFTLAVPTNVAAFYISNLDFPGVIRAMKDLRTDLGEVTGIEPVLSTEKIPKGTVVIAGTLGKSPVIDKLVKSKKMDITCLSGKWESYLIQVIEKPLHGIDYALVIAGSDKRGTIYGIYEVSEQIGVSPWYWWADVPVKKKDSIFIKPGVYSLGEPAVRYRGIFINDEAPALSGWTYEKFGGFNHKLYEKVFELILRLKGNFLWPAMWGNAFYDDDTLNPILADEYGIVIGTSHHEPLMRAHDEWRRYGTGPWNYEANEAQLKKFWEQGINRMGSMEGIVTLGMRGDGDMPMTEESNIALLERIIADQRKILAETTGKNVTEIPQVWALYKEVQEYYDKGMRVPDDVTLLLCDDNWGNVRRLPPPNERDRRGGYGMYYHFDFVGGPRNYKWLNTVQIQRIWEQMHLSYQYGVDHIWIVNVGDIKPMEFPISFFLDYAWDPEKWPADRLNEYTLLWAEQQFGNEYAAAIAELLSKYTQFNARRKPEMLSPETYSLVHYREAEKVMTEYNHLSEKAQRIYDLLPDETRDAYYQLVLFPVLACSNLTELYVTVGQNRMFARQGRASTNTYADRARELYRQDSILTDYYNKKMANGKWNHMMDQTHIGYTSWQQPDKNSMPAVQVLVVPEKAGMGLAVEGSAASWPESTSQAELPVFTVFEKDRHYVDIFNRGQPPFTFTVETPFIWMNIVPRSGRIGTEKRLWVDVNWKQVPFGNHRVPITVTNSDSTEITFYASISKPDFLKPEEVSGFIESAGYCSIEAEHYSNAVDSPTVRWLCIPGLSRTLSGLTPMPVTAQRQVPDEQSSPRLEYKVYFTDTGKATINAYFSPTLNFKGGEGLHYAFSIDDEMPQIVNLHENETIPDWKYPHYWNDAVSNNIKIKGSEHRIHTRGNHILKFWMVDPGLVLQRIVVDMGGVKPSYLGPPESFFHPAPLK